MQFEGRRRSSNVLNLTPLIDVVFLLLVFFMLTSHFVREEQLKVDLPLATSGSVDDSDHLQVVLDRQGRILIHGQFIDPNALETQLRADLQGRKDRLVRIRGDRTASLGLAVRVLDAARDAGADGVDIVTERQ